MDDRVEAQMFAVVKNRLQKQAALAKAREVGLVWASSSKIPDGAGGFIRGHYRMRFVRWKKRYGR